MLKKRLVAVVLVKNSWCVQSFGYKRYLPLGKPECLVVNFDRWGADEILVQVIERSVNGSGPDFVLLEQLGKLGLRTPLIYGGGIRSVADGVKLIQLGADRIIIDTLLHDDFKTIRELSRHLGAQALIASLPLAWHDGKLVWFDYRYKTFTFISDEVVDLIQSGIVSEIMISDCEHEGMVGGFELKLIEKFPFKEKSIIAFGGISKPDQMKVILQYPAVAAVAVGNFLSYREHAIQYYKTLLTGTHLRNAYYQNKSLVGHDIDG